MIFTIGHSTRTLDELVAVLKAWDIAALVDIRSIPRSRTNPQFDADVLGAALAHHGIAYHRVPELGGLRGRTKGPGASVNLGWENESFRNYADHALTPTFEAGLRALADIASRGNVAIMCAEMLWWRCHRRIVADHLLARGIPVTHVFDETKAEPAQLTRFAKVSGTKVTYPAGAIDTARGGHAPE